MESLYKPTHTDIFIRTNQKAALKKSTTCSVLQLALYTLVRNNSQRSKTTNQRPALGRCWSSESQKMTEN